MSTNTLLPCPVFSHQAPTLTSSVVNDACWKFVEAMPHSLPGPVFNDLKPAVHAAILHYHAHLSSAPQPPQAQADARDAESDYQRGYRHGYNRRCIEVQGALL